MDAVTISVTSVETPSSKAWLCNGLSLKRKVLTVVLQRGQKFVDLDFNVAVPD